MNPKVSQSKLESGSRKDEKERAKLENRTLNKKSALKRQDDPSESDEEVDEDTYEKDSFIVESDEESDFGDDDEADARPKLKKRVKKNEERLDSEDEDLIREYQAGNRRLKKIKSKTEPDRPEIKSEDYKVKYRERDYLPERKVRPARMQEDYERGDDAEEADDAEADFEKVDIQNIFGPQDLAQHYETPADKLIINTDLPERLQTRFKYRDLPKNQELIDETKWIMEKIASRHGLMPTEAHELQIKILKVLEFLRLSHYEIMFIWQHKRHEFTSRNKEFGVFYELNLADLWFIYQLDQDWDDLYKKKAAVRKMLDILKIKINVHTSIYELFENSYDEKIIDYIYEYAEHHIKKYFDDDEYYSMLDKPSNFKKLKKRNFSREIVKFGLNTIAEQITLLDQQLAENIQTGKQVHIPPSLDEKPDVIAGKIIKNDVSYLSNPVETVTTICEYIAREYFYHPVIRKYLRKMYNDRVLVSTEPNDKGKSITVYDYYYPAKHISEKKPSSISKELWLLMLEAENKDLITIKFDFGSDSKRKKNEIISKLKGYVLYETRRKDHMNLTINDMWDVVREEILSKLINNYVMTSFELQMRKELTEAAESFLIGLCTDYFKDLINMKPYKENGEVKVLSCDSDENDKACFCIINEDGQLQDYIVLNNIMKKPREHDHSQKILYANAVKELDSFIRKHMPHVIVVAPKNIRSQSLKIELNNIREQIYEASGVEKPFVMWGNLKIARIFAKSEISQKYLKDYPELVKEAVSMARYIQNPLAETLNLWDDDLDKNLLLFLSFHPLQPMVNKKILKDRLEVVLLEIINRKGVDINQCVRQPHLDKQLQFICGLGPRKAKTLVEKIKSSQGYIKKRSELLKTFLDVNNYTNAAGFLKINEKIDPKTIERPDATYDWLDFTRIHPEYYKIATKIAREALEDSVSSENVILIKVFQNEALLQALDLQDYAKHLSEQHNCNMKVLIETIEEEFKKPFFDHRHSFVTKFNKEEIFYSLSNESPSNFREESIISLKILSIDDKGIKAITDNGLIGLINNEDIKDNTYDINTNELKRTFPIGTYVKGKVKSINFENVRARFSLKNEDLNNHKEFLRKNAVLTKYGLNEGLDFIIDRDSDYPILSIEGRRKLGRFVPRRINHPHFRNIGLSMAQEYLSERLNGEFVFRPSSKGTDYINLTWKLFEDIIAHIPIKEGYKTTKDDISNKLSIHKQDFESLDDIIESYIKPCNMHIKNIVSEPKFLKNNIDFVKQTLIDEKKVNSSRIPYYFSFTPEYPQFVVLSYILNKLSVKHELIKIKPDGLHFHEICFPSLSHIIKYFKERLKTPEYQRYIDQLPKIELGIKSKSDKGHVKSEVKQEYSGSKRNRHRNEDSESLERYKHKKEYRSHHRDGDRSGRRRQRSRSESSQNRKRSKREHRDYSHVKTEHNVAQYSQTNQNEKTRTEYDDFNVKFEDAN